MAVAEPFVSAERCGTCHVAEYEQWQSSRHRVAHTNDLYQAGLFVEPQAFCVRCHAPLPAQQAEVFANFGAYRSRDPSAERAPEPHAAEGITCVACHDRDGAMAATSVSGRAPHATVVDETLSTSAFCADCHQFEMPSFRTDGVAFTGELMQATYAEWQAWGGSQQCQDCHMPAGAHTFAGAHDREALAASFEVRVRRDTLRLRSRGVGHRHPTGDLFRHVTVEVDTGDGFEVVHRIGKTWRIERDAAGHSQKRLEADNTLVPGQWRDVGLPPGWIAWRVRYHYGSELDEHRGFLDPDAIVVTVAEGR